jgi:hypothetical protein
MTRSIFVILMIAMISPPAAAAADPIRVTAGLLHFEGPDPFIGFHFSGAELDVTGKGFADAGLDVIRHEVVLRDGAAADISVEIPLDRGVSARLGNGSDMSTAGAFRFDAAPTRLTHCTGPRPIVCNASSTFRFSGDLRLVDALGNIVFSESLSGRGRVAATISGRQEDPLIGLPLALSFDFGATLTPEPPSLILIAVAIGGLWFWRG